MAKEESNIQNSARLELSKRNCTTFRNNVGLAWYGKDRDIPVRYGLCNGSSDLIGWKKVVITPDMVGKTVALFLAVEIKTESGVVSKEQSQFISAVNNAGGIAGVARSVDDAISLVSR